MDFAGKTVLVTGASRGVGAAIARAFAGEGAAVAVNFLQNTAAADATVAACEALGEACGAARGLEGGGAVAFQADVTDRQAADDLVRQVLQEFGKIDVLVNNAFRPYTFDPEARKLHWELDWSDYQTQFEGAVKAAHGMAQAVLPAMLSRGSGAIVNIATNLVARPIVPYHDYTTAKAALIGFSQNLAMELGPLGIRVNTVAPGLVYPTDASRAVKETVRDAISAQTPLRRIATPEDVAGPVLFLASDWSRFMTGQTLYVDGGLVMG